MLSITLKRRPLLGRAGIEQLTNYDYPDIGLWHVSGAPFLPTKVGYQGPAGYVEALVLSSGEPWQAWQITSP
jgi:hypothetical protein